MAYDAGLEERMNEYFFGRKDVQVKKMFGGLCYMVNNHMCCGILGDTLMARVGNERYSECLAQKHVREMDFIGKVMKGMVYVLPEGIAKEADLTRWITVCESFVQTLPPRRK
ncbi:TfoX/Sxy family protein [Teredinibacter sp. KSP-S5-2]|uniref:TfoX/Sxy family protein n=1 Tax=Teredinibacter sp. KSP-S5-2 TaxID=3034506 RepID=UPI00293495F5|nr:TfoX/Sxy family protein [Teredinibacter sp. KSP-S5-2]WNO07659.1 TfoX/Sxy family protein [Teredinibacter sp. KSP-S5-2]